MSTRGDRRRTGEHGRDGAQARTGAEVEHPAAGDDLGVVAEVASDRQAAAPRERPIGKRGVGVAGLHLDRMPQREGLVREVEPDAFQGRHRAQVRVAQDEGARGGRHGRTVRLRVRGAWTPNAYWMRNDDPAGRAPRAVARQQGMGCT